MMAAMHDASRAVLALTNRMGDVGVPPLRSSEVWGLLDHAPDPGALFGLAAADLVADVGLDPALAERVVRLLDAGIALAVRLDELHRRGIFTLTPFDPDYPHQVADRLGHRAPVVLFGAGSASLLARRGVAALDLAAAAPDQVQAMVDAVLAGDRHLVVGGDGPADQAALALVTDAGGTGVVVLADPLDRVLADPQRRRSVLSGRTCWCTPYPPDAPRTPEGATARRRVIAGLVTTTLVFAHPHDEIGAELIDDLAALGAVVIDEPDADVGSLLRPGPGG